MSGVRLPTEKLVQRLDWLDTAIIELRDRSRLLQAESMLKGAEQANRNPHLLAIMTIVFLPTSSALMSGAAVDQRQLRVPVGDANHRRVVGYRLLAVEALRPA